MPSLAAFTFPSLIQSIPVSEHSVHVNAAFWQEKFARAGQVSLWNAIFSGSSSIRLTRHQLLHGHYTNPTQKCVEILLWGYPNDMRGLVSNLLLPPSLPTLVKCAGSSDSWPKYWNNFNKIGRIGISTITKLAYFYKKTFSDHQALILDGRLIEATARWTETTVADLSYITASHHYEEYLKTMAAAAKRISCQADQLELFLFTLGDCF